MNDKQTWSLEDFHRQIKAKFDQKEAFFHKFLFHDENWNDKLLFVQTKFCLKLKASNFQSNFL